MRWIMVGLLVLLVSHASEAALPRMDFDQSPQSSEPLDDEARYRLYLRFCAMYQNRRQAQWLLSMEFDSFRIYQQFTPEQRHQWWSFVSEAVGCAF